VIALATDDALLRRFATEHDAAGHRAPPARPDLSHHADADRGFARVVWANRIVDEYRSVAVFGELLHLLADLEAPYPALCAVQRLIGDELRHTRLCADVVDWLGGSGDLAIDLAGIGLPAREADEPPAIRALHIVARELVVAEDESITMIAAFRDAATEPAVREALGLLLVDEVRHAAAGRALLRLFTDGPLRAPVADALPALPALLDADRAELRARYLSEARGGPGRALGACLQRQDLVVGATP
jgi:hypothetical protein